MVAGPPKVKLMVFCCLVVSAYLFFVAKILAGGQAGKRGSSGLTEVQKKRSYESFFTVTASDSHFKRYTRRFAAGCAGETFSARSGLFGGGSGLLFITLLSGRSGLSPLLGAPAGRGKGKIWGLSGLLQPQADPSGTANVSCPHRLAGNQNLFHPLGTVNIREQKG